MQAGKLRKRMVLQLPSETSGDAVVSWTDVATVWGSREGLTTLNRGGLTAEVEHRLTIRHRDDVTPKMRLVDGDRAFGIVSAVDPTGRRKELTILATELV
jgi:SPP1 family predicted phage head-tail adaptor